MSESTISHLLNREGYYLQACKKGLLTKTDVKKCRIFAHRMRSELSDQVRTKEIAFTLTVQGLPTKEILWIKHYALKREYGARKARVWCKKSKGLMQECTAKARKTGLGDELSS